MVVKYLLVNKSSQDFLFPTVGKKHEELVRIDRSKRVFEKPRSNPPNPLRKGAKIRKSPFLRGI
jgi:hypothetical protein